MKVAILFIVTLLVLLNISWGKAELDSDEYDQFGPHELIYDDSDERDQDLQDQEYRDSRGIFGKKKKKKPKISFGGDDSDEDDDCKTNDDCKFYKYCSNEKKCVNRIGRKRRQLRFGHF